ncbi:MAG: phosphoribosylamine--glycine ligase, partial [Gammaproteobacteria bacterium]
MSVLIIGNGGREHALAWKAARSPLVERVFVAPGNGGTALEPGVENVPIQASDTDALCAFALEKKITLTIVGPEAPLCAGLVDAFQERGLACLGPSRAAAALEGSKSFAKAFMARHGIPTAPYAVFSDPATADSHLKTQAYPVVIKADGLAGGKGVFIVQDQHQAMEALRSIMALSPFGAAGPHGIVIEELVAGDEASFIVLTDGEHVLPLASSQDHKTLEEGDCGPNTGGMGAYSPAAVISEPMQGRILKEIIEPTLNGMKILDRPYRGFLYAGLMLSEDCAPVVLEFNCRLGYPETQVILPRFQSDLIGLCRAA